MQPAVSDNADHHEIFNKPQPEAETRTIELRVGLL